MSDTLKKSMASQVQASQLSGESQLKIDQRLDGAESLSLPRKELTPLDEGDLAEDLEQRSRSFRLLSLWYQVSQEVGRHCGERGGEGEEQTGKEVLELWEQIEARSLLSLLSTLTLERRASVLAR